MLPRGRAKVLKVFFCIDGDRFASVQVHALTYIFHGWTCTSARKKFTNRQACAFLMLGCIFSGMSRYIIAEYSLKLPDTSMGETIEDAERVRVVVRVRPPNDRELQQSSSHHV